MIKSIHFFGPDRDDKTEVMRVVSSWGETRHRIPYVRFHHIPALERTNANRADLINSAIAEHIVETSF